VAILCCFCSCSLFQWNWSHVCFYVPQGDGKHFPKLSESSVIWCNGHACLSPFLLPWGLQGSGTDWQLIPWFTSNLQRAIFVLHSSAWTVTDDRNGRKHKHMQAHTHICTHTHTHAGMHTRTHKCWKGKHVSDVAILASFVTDLLICNKRHYDNGIVCNSWFVDGSSIVLSCFCCCCNSCSWQYVGNLFLGSSQ